MLISWVVRQAQERADSGGGERAEQPARSRVTCGACHRVPRGTASVGESPAEPRRSLHRRTPWPGRPGPPDPEPEDRLAAAARAADDRLLLRRPTERAADPAAGPGRGLDAAAGGSDGDDLLPRLLRLADGRLVPLPVARWAGPVRRAPTPTLLERARGPVLDVGCGPGRLTAALHARGERRPRPRAAAGRSRCWPAPPARPLLLGDVLDPVPRAGGWRTVLLADGNVGIGGDAGRCCAAAGRCSPRRPRAASSSPRTPTPRRPARSGAGPARGARHHERVVPLGAAGHGRARARPPRCRAGTWSRRGRSRAGSSPPSSAS